MMRTSHPFIIPPIYNNTLYIPQGGALYQMAILGSTKLVNEIYDDWYQIHSTSQTIIPPLTVLIPGGTCTTALLVHHAIQDRIRKEKSKMASSSSSSLKVLDIKIVVIPCVGDEIYARQQMIQLNHQIISLYEQQDRYHNNHNSHPIDLKYIQIDDIPYILSPNPNIIQKKNHLNNMTKHNNTNYFPFGKPNQLILQTYYQLYNETNITFDLIYGSPSWTILLRHLNYHHKKEQQEHNKMEQQQQSSSSPVQQKQQQQNNHEKRIHDDDNKSHDVVDIMILCSMIYICFNSSFLFCIT